MVTARLASFGLSSLVVEDEAEEEVAAVELRRVSDGGTIRVGEVPFTLDASGWVSKTVTLAFEGVRVASAARTGVLRPRYDVTVDAGLLGTDAPVGLTLRPSLTLRTFEVWIGGQEAGAVYRHGFLGRRLEVDLSDRLPLGVQVFLLALVLIEWRRASRRSA